MKDKRDMILFLPDETKTIRGKFFFLPLIGCLPDTNRYRLNFPIHPKHSIYPFAAS